MNTTNNEMRAVLHMDLDSFFVSVECLHDHRLVGRPLIVGGKGDRGVVAACSYEARYFGVHSAMPMKLALQLCPDAVVISGDMEAYTRFSNMVTDIIANSAPLYEKSSIDEFYLDLSGMDRFLGTYKWATELRAKITKETHLPISMGLSVNKLVSKVATGESKPNGQRQIPRGTESTFLAPLPIRRIPMIGKKTSNFLYEMGIRYVKTLREMPVEMLEAVFGKNGRVIWNRSWGIDNSPIVPYHERKSISTESTFHQDTIDIKMLKSILTGMTGKLAFQLRSENKLTSCVAVKIRYTDFETTSKQTHIPYTASDKALTEHVLELFDRLYTRRVLVRLVGVRLSKLVHGNYQIDLFDDTQEEINLYNAIDCIKSRHGSGMVQRASSLATNSKQYKDLQYSQPKVS